jgi:hypothetical protein
MSAVHQHRAYTLKPSLQHALPAHELSSDTVDAIAAAGHGGHLRVPKPDSVPLMENSGLPKPPMGMLEIDLTRSRICGVDGRLIGDLCKAVRCPAGRQG